MKESKWVVLWAVTVIITSLAVSFNFMKRVGTIPVYACVMTDIVDGSRLSSGKMSEFCWAVFGLDNVKMQTSSGVRIIDGFDYEFTIIYYPASCEHTIGLSDPLGSERIRLRYSDTSVFVVSDNMTAFDTSFAVASGLIRLLEIGALIRW